METLLSGAKKLGVDLTPEQLSQFDAYYQELVAWNRKMNLTAIVDYEEVQVKHFLDSLTVALAFAGKPPPNLLDVGTGAGFPGIPLKIVFPEMRLALLESVAKKTGFLDHLLAELGLGNAEILTGRAEDFARDEKYRERFAFVVSRGVAKLSTLVELALPFCALGGTFVAQKRGELESEIAEARGAIDVLGGKLREVMSVGLEELGDRALIIIDKVSATPERYPRRAGIPAKRPLKLAS